MKSVARIKTAVARALNEVWSGYRTLSKLALFTQNIFHKIRTKLVLYTQGVQPGP